MKRYLFVTGWLAALLLAILFMVSLVRAQDTGRATLRLWDGAGNVTDFECVALAPVDTPTPDEFTPVPTDTPTITPSPTQTVTPSPTLTPSPTATPIPLCQGTTTASLNFRAGPGTSYAILQDLTQTPPVNIVFPKGAVIPINGWTQTGGAIWLKTVYKAQAGWVSAAYVTLSAGCKQEFPDYPF